MYFVVNLSYLFLNLRVKILSQYLIQYLQALQLLQHSLLLSPDIHHSQAAALSQEVYQSGYPSYQPLLP